MDLNFLDHYVKHAINLERLSLSAANNLTKLVGEIDNLAIVKIDRVLQLYANGSLTQVTLQQSLTDLFELYADGFGPKFREKIAKDMTNFVSSELNFQRDSLNFFTNDNISPLGVISAEQMTAVASAQTIQNASLSAWIDTISSTKADKLTAAVRIGIASGDSVAEISASLGDIMKLSKNNTTTLVRTTIQSVASSVRNTVFKENPDIVQGVTWLSTLDNRTTINICAPRDHKKYSIDGKPIGHDLTWHGGPGNAHWNCRSTSVPLIGEESLAGRRPAISAGKNYESGDNITRTGRVRKATKNNRESGIFRIQQVNSNTTYEDWLIRQPAAFQDDILGIKRGKLFRDGSINLSDLSNRFGEPITLDELIARNLTDVGGP